MSSLFSELRRRRVLRTLALYILGTWGLMQVADVLLPALSLPESLIRYLLLVAVAGFPVALVFGWFFDVTTDGIRRTPPATLEEAAHAAPLRGVDYLLLSALLLVLGLISYGVLENADDLESMIPTAERDSGPPMIGVLPFSILGGGEDGTFFAAGAHDDLLNRLAQIQGLRVISRTSVLKYAGSEKLITQIGTELGADAILEGGIRIVGDQMRINVQLIDATTDDNLWAETYDRQLTADNIFGVQSDIARAIALALQANLSPADEEQLTTVPTSNLAAYRAFHEAMRYQEAYSPGYSNYQETLVNTLEKAIELDPRFTRPMMELVGAIARVNFSDQNPEDIATIESLVTDIGELAPASVDHLTAQAYYFYYVLHDYERADELIDSARRKAPSDTRLLEIQASIKRRKGDFDGFVETTRLASALEPSDKLLKARLIYRLLTVHRYEEARRLAKKIQQPDLRLRALIAELNFSQHKNLAQLRQDLEPHLGEGSASEQRSYYASYWEVLVAQRDYAEAARIVPILTALHGEPESESVMKAEMNYGLLLSFFSGQKDPLANGITGIKEGLGMDSLDPIEWATLKILEGEPELGKARVLEYLRSYAHSPTAMFFMRESACQTLGLSGSIQETVDCLRDALANPSGVDPYFEPLLPYYDSIRESLEFQTLVSELKAEGWL